jgi:hypothetical protein
MIKLDQNKFIPAVGIACSRLCTDTHPIATTTEVGETLVAMYAMADEANTIFRFLQTLAKKGHFPFARRSLVAKQNKFGVIYYPWEWSKPTEKELNTPLTSDTGRQTVTTLRDLERRMEALEKRLNQQ